MKRFAVAAALLVWYIAGQAFSSFTLETACGTICTLSVQNTSPAIGRLLWVRVDGKPATFAGDVPILPGQTTVARLYTRAGDAITSWDTIDYAIGTLPGPITAGGHFSSR